MTKNNLSTKELDEQMIKLSKELPANAPQQMEKVLKQFFEERGVEYNKQSIMACICMGHLFIPQLPPMYAEFVHASLLCLYNLLDKESAKTALAME